MIIGVPKEIKKGENRVAVIPAGVRTLVEKGHTLFLQKGAGSGSGISDDEYRLAGAQIVESAEDVYGEAELIVKVKEPLLPEFDLLRSEQTLFTFLHLAPAAELTRVLMEKGLTAVAYETVQLDDGSLPLLRPMSEIAGRMAVQIGAHYLQKECGGSGVLLAGAPGVRQGRCLILGAGTVGGDAVRIAAGMGSDVTVLDIDPARLAAMENQYGNRIHTIFSNAHSIEEEVRNADLVIGAVLLPGARAPKLINRQMLGKMKEGSVIVDVAIDQGGCVETIRVTTHEDPVYFVDGVLHYGVANIPGAVSRTSTYALANSTIPYICQIADLGIAQACRQSGALYKGVNIHAGKLCSDAVAQALNIPFSPFSP